MANNTPAAVEGKPVVIIEGDLVKITRTIVDRQVRTSELLSELAQLQPLRTGIMPHGTISFVRCTAERNQVVTLYVIERPAGIVTIRYKEGHSNDQQTDQNIVEHRLSWPHTQWYVKHIGTAITDLYVTCTKTPIKELSDKVFILPMPNIFDYGNGGVCLGNLVVPESITFAQRVQCLLESVMQSLWNSDLPANLEPVGLESLAAWAERSKEDPQLGLTLNYQPHRAGTFENLMATVLGDTQ